MKTIYLVACVRQKASSPQPAEALYRSDWFVKARQYVLRHRVSGDLWFILSAKYGLVEPARVIPPYEKTLLTMSKPAREAWAEKAVARLLPVLQPRDRVVFLAGQRYRQFLEPALTGAGYRVDVPMRGLGIGRQLAFLSVPPHRLF